jgi:hypothetical protein
MRNIILLLGLVTSFSSQASYKERYEIKFNQNISSDGFSTELYIQNAQLVTPELAHGSQKPFCQLRISYGNTVLNTSEVFTLGRPYQNEDNDERRMIHFPAANFLKDKLEMLVCSVTSKANSLNEINQILGPLGSIQKSQQVTSEDLKDSSLASPCERKVIDHYAGIYHRTWKAANNTFLNNFIGRKNMFAHTLGEPNSAFNRTYLYGEDYIANAIIEKSKKTGQEVFETYMRLLRFEQLCLDLGNDYKKPRKVRKYLLQHLKPALR